MGREHPPLIEAEALATLLETGAEVVLLDVRWRLGQSGGRADHAAGHLPGAVFVDMEAELCGPPSPESGRHPLPQASDFAAAARSWGINQSSSVVFYDATGALAAARGWWLLRHAGFDDVHVLNGGLETWITAGYSVESGPVIAEVGNVELGWGQMQVITIDEAAAFPEHGILLDSRAAERYSGQVEPIDPRAGHIPGALSRPTTANITDEHLFLAPAQLRRELAALGISDGTVAPQIAAYCGSGITAAHQILALSTIGVQAALYPGSWSQYCADDSRVAATGMMP